MDNSINLVGVRWQPSHNRHPVDGVLVGAGSLWLKDALRMRNNHNISHVNRQTKICLYQMSIIRSMKIFNVNVILDHFVKCPHLHNHKHQSRPNGFQGANFWFKVTHLGVLKIEKYLRKPRLNFAPVFGRLHINLYQIKSQPSKHMMRWFQTHHNILMT